MFKKALLGLLLALPLVSFAAVPRPLLDMAIPAPAGKISLKQYRGKVMAVAIFSTTCGDCVKVIEILNRAQKDYGSKGFQAVAGSGDENAQYLIGPFKQRYNITYPIGYLTKDEMIKLGDIPKDKRPVAPIVLFVDRKGTVKFQYYGDDNFLKGGNEQGIRALIQHLLDEK